MNNMHIVLTVQNLFEKHMEETNNVVESLYLVYKELDFQAVLEWIEYIAGKAFTK